LLKGLKVSAGGDIKKGKEKVWGWDELKRIKRGGWLQPLQPIPWLKSTIQV
jgi:hypothetical protein